MGGLLEGIIGSSNRRTDEAEDAAEDFEDLLLAEHFVDVGAEQRPGDERHEHEPLEQTQRGQV